MEVTELWNKRFFAWYQEIAPKLRYVFSSGLAAFLLLLFIGCSYYYGKLVEDVPGGFPIVWVCLAVLVPVASYSPVRSFLQQADVIFLLPREASMRPYIRRSLLYGMAVQSFALFVCWVALYPLYRACLDKSAEPLLLLLVGWLVLKAVNLYGRWLELCCVDSHTAWIFRLFRYVLTILGVAGLVKFGAAKGFVFLLVITAFYLVLLRLPKRYVLPWDRLIEKEREARSRTYLWLSWFVEMPELPKRVYPRRYMDWLTKGISFEQKTTYSYLYLKTFLRSEWFGMIVRLVLVGSLLIVVLPSDWIKAAIYAVFVLLIGAQLTSLEQAHRHSLWVDMMPIEPIRRTEALLSLIPRIHITAALLLAISVECTGGALWARIVVPVAGACFGFSFAYYYLRHKWTKLTT